MSSVLDLMGLRSLPPQNPGQGFKKQMLYTFQAHLHDLFVTHQKLISRGTPIFELPDELLLQISQYLDYDDLRRYKLTCRRIYMLNLDRVLDATLFRGTFRPVPQIGAYNVKGVKLHPIFKELNLLKTSIDQCFILNRHGKPSRVKVMDSKCWNQMATDPPVATIRFAIARLPIQAVSNKYGVRVANLVGRICKFLDKDNKKGLKLSDVWFQYFDESQWGIRRATDHRVAKNIDMLGSNRTSTGFVASHKTPKGALVLKTSYYW